MKDKELYIAEVSVCLTENWIYNAPEASETLGIFLVEPVLNKNIFRKKIAGYKEVVTGETITKLEFRDFMGEFKIPFDIDIHSNTYIVPGDLIWKINKNTSAYRILDEEIINKYLSQSEEEVESQLNAIREEARNIGRAKSHIKNLEKIRTR